MEELIDMSGSNLRPVGNGVMQVEWADRHAIEFSQEPVRLGYRSEQEGRDVFEDRDFIKISFPGDKTKVVNRQVTEEDKVRYARQWQQYKANQEQTPEGTPLKHWTLATKADVLNLAVAGVKTVEQLAGLSDVAIQGLGAGFLGLRERAQRWVAATADAAPLNKLMARVEQLEADNQRLNNELTRRGRPPKQENTNA